MSKRIPTQLTTEPTPWKAYTLTGPQKYITHEYMAYMKRRDAREARQAANAQAPERVNADTWNGNTLGKRKYRERICVVESCQRPFTPTAPRQRTCGSEDCKKERKRQTTASWYRDTKKEQVA